MLRGTLRQAAGTAAHRDVRRRRRDRAAHAARPRDRALTEASGPALPGDRPDDPDISFVARRAAAGDRRLRASIELDDVVVRQPAEEIDEPQDRVVRHLREEPHPALQLPRLELRDEPDRTIEEPDERGERRQPRVQLLEFPVAGGIGAARAAASEVCSITFTIGSPSRTLRWAMTLVNHCQWSPTAT